MEAQTARHIKNGEALNHLFPVARGQTLPIKKNADVADTVAFIPQVVYETLHDTKKIAGVLKGATLNETCSRIWHFVYNHVRYSKDKDGVEQIRSPARVWHDRASGVDCDCYTVFISSILTNLGIPHSYRITKYNHKSYYQHIYPIVPTQNGKYITIDCVVNQYNYEAPYTYKKDTTMELHYLNGTDTPLSLDALAVMGTEDDFEGIGKINFSHIKDKAKQTLHTINRINPATGLLRLGLLASMKLNLFKVAGHLRYAYLTKAQAEEQNLDPIKLDKLSTVLKKLESIFYGAGGKTENLREAILTGKGNKDKAVNVLGMLDNDTHYDEYTPLPIVLSGIYTEENSATVGALGEPVTGAAIAAASSAMAVIAGLVKQIGSLTKDGTPTPVGDEGTPTDSITITTPNSTNMPVLSTNNSFSEARLLPTTATTNEKPMPNGTPSADTFLTKAKAWVTEHPMQASIIAISVTALGVLAVSEFTKKKPRAKRKGLSGVASKKGKRASYAKQLKTPIALL